MRTTDRPSRRLDKPRTDAVRNRERVLEAAKAVFSAGGADASLEAVARRAGVGIGTLYRHFPTREALFEAVYRREVEQLGDLAEQLKSEAEPVDALRRWLQVQCRVRRDKEGYGRCAGACGVSPDRTSCLRFDRLTKAVGALLERAVAAGEIRSDIRAEDLAAGAGRHVLHARPARLAADGCSIGRCVRRWPSRAGRSGETSRVAAAPPRCRQSGEGEPSATAVRNEPRAMIAIWCVLRPRRSAASHI